MAATLALNRLTFIYNSYNVTNIRMAYITTQKLRHVQQRQYETLPLNRVLTQFHLPPIHTSNLVDAILMQSLHLLVCLPRGRFERGFLPTVLNSSLVPPT